MSVVMQEIIGRFILVKENLAAADTDDIFPYFLPEMKATSTQIAELERTTDFKLPDGYRAFLSLANGWRCVLVRTSLLNTDEIPAAQQAVLQRPEVLSCLSAQGVKSFLVVGASDADDNLYIISADGRVYWYAHGEIEAFRNFPEFMESLLAHNKELLVDVQDGRWKL